MTLLRKKLALRHLLLPDGEAVDLIVENGLISSVSPAGTSDGDEKPDGDETERIDFEGRTYASSGWIDMHVHAFPEFDPYGDEIDEIGVRQGVTAIVDAGSCGADRIGELAASGERADTRLFAFLNVSRIGLARIDELSDLGWIDAAKAAEAAVRLPDAVVGFKARISRSVVGGSGLEPLRMARRLSNETGLPLMVHIGSGPPDIREILALLESKDILTHCFHGKPNHPFDADGRPLAELRHALERGVRLDVGHGTASFSFRTAEAALREGIRPHTISTDIYRGNRLNGPVFSLANVLSKFLHLGYSLPEVIEAVTSEPAQWLRRPELGRIRAGEPANLTLFSVEGKLVRLVDSEEEIRTADKIIKPWGVVANGKLIKCEVRA